MGRIRNKLVFEKQKMIVLYNNLINRLYRKPDIKTIDETLDAILERKASISRFGDGEFDIIFGRFQPFQPYNDKLGQRLAKVLKSNDISPTFLVGIPDCYGDLSHYITEAQFHWKRRLDRERYKWYRILNRNAPYYQAQISRFYHDWNDKSQSQHWADKLKKIWENRNVFIVEGEKTRMGVGNDLFEKSQSIRRILCPAVNAFGKYETILDTIHKLANKEDLILIALGPTASVLSFDLHNSGYQAIDIGHIDIEYEWMKIGALEKVRIPGRFMNELDGGKYVDDSIIDQSYFDQIVSVID